MRRCASSARVQRASFSTRSAPRTTFRPLRAIPAHLSGDLSRSIPTIALASVPIAVPRRQYSQAVTAQPDFRDYKRTTGLVGIPVIPPKEARQIFMMVCEKVLSELRDGIPQNAAYRVGSEGIYAERMKIAKENPDPRDIERLVDCGQIEELIIQAENELKLIPEMRANKPWEVEPGKRIPITVREAAPEIKDKTGALVKPPAAPAK